MKKMMMSLAGYDPKVASLCPVHDQNKYAAMGGAILITVFMAVFGALHLAKDVTDSFLASLSFAFFWGTIVLGFEYMMVNLFSNTKGKWLLLTMRILMSLALSLLLSLPFILMLFRGSISQQMADEKKDKITAVQAIYQAQKAEIDTTLNQRYRIKQARETSAMEEAEGVSGTGIKGMGQWFEYKQAAFDSAKAEYNRYREDAAIRTTEINNACAAEISQIEAYYSHDFLAQLMALLNLMKIRPIVIFQTFIVFFILLLLDLMPIILKTTSSLKNEDDIYNQLVKQEQTQKLNSGINSIRQENSSRNKNNIVSEMPGRAGFQSFKDDATTMLLIMESMNEYLNLAKDSFGDNESLKIKAEKYLSSLSSKSIDSILKIDRNRKVGYEGILLSDNYKVYIGDESILKPHHPFAANIDIIQTVRDLTANLEGEEAKFNALYDWCAANITYDLDHESHSGYRTAIETFNSKSGVCGEMAVLLIVMCRLVGIRADYVSVTKDAKGKTVTHACAGIMMDGIFRLADTAYSSSDILHQEYEVEPDEKVLQNYTYWNQNGQS